MARLRGAGLFEKAVVGFFGWGAVQNTSSRSTGAGIVVLQYTPKSKDTRESEKAAHRSKRMREFEKLDAVDEFLPQTLSDPKP